MFNYIGRYIVFLEKKYKDIGFFIGLLLTVGHIEVLCIKVVGSAKNLEGGVCASVRFILE